MKSGYKDLAALSVDEARRVVSETEAFVAACVESLGRDVPGCGDHDSGKA